MRVAGTMLTARESSPLPMPDNWPPLRRSNEFPWGEVIGGALLAAIPISIILILLFR